MPLKLFIEYDLKRASFYQEEKLIYTGITKTGFLKIEWTLYDQSNNQIAFFKYSKKILRLNGKIIIEFSTPQPIPKLILYHTVWKGPRLEFDFENHSYLIVFHKGNQYSFFKDNNQFALLRKKSLSIGYTKEYNVVADERTSIALLAIMSYSILIATEDEYEDSSELSVDRGRIGGKDYREFDSYWSPI